MGDSGNERRYDFRVINLHQLNVGVITGLGLIFIGIAPGALQAIIDGIIKNADRLAGRIPQRSFPVDEFPQPRWLAPLGVGIVVASFLAYYAR